MDWWAVEESYWFEQLGVLVVWYATFLWPRTDMNALQGPLWSIPSLICLTSSSSTAFGELRLPCSSHNDFAFPELHQVCVGLCTCHFLCLEYFSPHSLRATPIISSETCLNNTSARVIFKMFFLNSLTSTVRGTEQNQVVVDPCWARNSSFNSFIVENVSKEEPGQTTR